jgi:hypothetical protein
MAGDLGQEVILKPSSLREAILLSHPLPLLLSSHLEQVDYDGLHKHSLGIQY